MYFKQFQNHIRNTQTGAEVLSQCSCYGSTIVETVDGIFINNSLTDFTNLEEAKQHIRNLVVQQSINEQITQELYEELSPVVIADIITNHHNIRVTDTLIESYIELASSKIFTLDPVVKDIKTFNKLDTVLENHLDFILEDGSKIIVSNDTLQHINNTFGEHADVIEYMRESKENFLSVLSQMIKEEL